jgi:hypothetical protein
MNGYLTFLQNLSEYQQKAEIAHTAFRIFDNIWDDSSSLEEDLLKMLAVFSETLEVDFSSWKLELRHYAEEPDVIGTPVFDADQCKAPFSLRYYPVGVFRSHEDLVVSGMIQVADNQRTLVGRLAASSTREESCAGERLVQLGVDPDTLETVAYDAAKAPKMPYLDYLETLRPQQRRDAIYRLSELAWGTDNPLFMDHPKLASELQRLGISELRIVDPCHQVGPVEFAGGRCTAPIWYPLYGNGYDEDGNFDNGPTYYVKVHILAGIANKPSGDGAIWVEDLWARFENIDEPPSGTSITLLVP